MSDYRTLSEVTEDYLRKRPDEIDDYITVLFDEYADYLMNMQKAAMLLHCYHHFGSSAA